MRRLVNVMKDFFLEGNPNPERIDCPGEHIIRSLAQDRLPAAHPARLHLAACSECFAEYEGFREEWNSQKKRLLVVGLALAASLIIVCGVALWRHSGSPSWRPRADVQIAAAQPMDADLDLFNAGTVRGAVDDPDTSSRISLPAELLKLSVTLPRFSQAGRYELLLLKEKSGTDVLARGSGEAFDRAGKVTADVALDLRAIRAGTYFLATVRQSDNGVYYYPVQVRRGDSENGK